MRTDNQSMLQNETHLWRPIVNVYADTAFSFFSPKIIYQVSAQWHARSQLLSLDPLLLHSSSPSSINLAEGIWWHAKYRRASWARGGRQTAGCAESHKESHSLASEQGGSWQCFTTIFDSDITTNKKDPPLIAAWASTMVDFIIYTMNTQIAASIYWFSGNKTQWYSICCLKTPPPPPLHLPAHTHKHARAHFKLTAT